MCVCVCVCVASLVNAIDLPSSNNRPDALTARGSKVTGNRLIPPMWPIARVQQEAQKCGLTLKPKGAGLSHGHGIFNCVTFEGRNNLICCRASTPLPDPKLEICTS